MYTTKLPGFGNLGVQVPNLDLEIASDEEIRELGEINLRELLTIVPSRGKPISVERFQSIFAQWAIELPNGGYIQHSAPEHMSKKHGDDCFSSPPQKTSAGNAIEDADVIESIKRMRKGIEHLKGLVRVTGKRDQNNNDTGMFSDGELDWHSNQQGIADPLPVVALLAWEGTKGSCTEFLNTAQAFADLSPAWKRTCESLIGVHYWTPQTMAPKLNPVQDEILRLTMCPVDGTPIPLVMNSPGGVRGFRFTYTTLKHFQGLSATESQEIYDFLMNHIFQPQYIYRHNWSDGDVLIMDNTITMHRRPTIDCSKRELYRMCFNYKRLLEPITA